MVEIKVVEKEKQDFGREVRRNEKSLKGRGAMIGKIGGKRG